MLKLSRRSLQESFKQWYESSEIPQLVSRHTLTVWSLMCSLVLVIGALALVGLIDPGVEPTNSKNSSSPSAFVTGESRGTRTPSTVTAWKLLLLLLGCSAGSWVMTYNLKSAKLPLRAFRPRVASRRVNRKVRRKSRPKAPRIQGSRGKTRRPASKAIAPIPSPSRRRSSRRLPQQSLALPASPPPRQPRRIQPQSPQPLPRAIPVTQAQPLRKSPLALPPQRAPQSGSLRDRIEPKITVVPAEQVMPLDRREPTLAEVMDLRKHHTLPSMMGRT